LPPRFFARSIATPAEGVSKRIFRFLTENFRPFRVSRGGSPLPFLQKFGKQHKPRLLNVEKLPLVTS
jgi:hypothetical protein